MITVNLLPDIKMDRIEADHRRKRVGGLMLLAIIAGVALPIVLIAVWGGQKALIALAQNGINDKLEKLQSTEGLAEELTVQNQLEELPNLYAKRLYYTTFTSLLPKLLPPTSGLSSFTVNENGTLTLDGTADSVATVNNLVNILANTVVVKDDVEQNLFANVVLTQIQPGEDSVTFSVTTTVDTQVFAKQFDGTVKVGDKVLVEQANSAEPITTDQTEENPGN